MTKLKQILWVLGVVVFFSLPKVGMAMNVDRFFDVFIEVNMIDGGPRVKATNSITGEEVPIKLRDVLRYADAEGGMNIQITAYLAPLPPYGPEGSSPRLGALPIIQIFASCTEGYGCVINDITHDTNFEEPAK